MKKGIFIAMAALGLALFAVPEAHGVDGQTLNVRLSGSSFITSSQDDGTPTPATGAFTSLQSGIAKGSGSAIFSAQTVVAEAALPDARCPAELPFGNDLTTTFVTTYSDGSILSGTSGTGSFFCTDGLVFLANFVGTITGGEGRFEGATGTWEATARTQSARVTGEVSIDLD